MSPQNQSVTADASARVLIIGGGPAGAACAISLARSGRDVTLAEQRPFPRDKVCGCCLGGTAHALLQSLGQSEWLRETALPLNQWRGHLGGYQVNVPMQTGFAISRRALDSHLLDVARRAGVNVLQPVSARIDLPRSMQRDPTATLREPIPVRFSAIQDCKTDRIITSDFDAVVLAAGLSASDAGWLPWIQRPHGPRGVHFMIADNGQIARAAIHMLCGDHGYVGLVRLEDGRIDVAAALWPHGLATPNPSVDSRDDESDAMFGRSHGEVDRMLRSIGGFTMDTRPLSGVHATGPLRRNRQRGRGRLLAIGDSAGYFEPFTGEGMTWAIQSGLDAARLLTQTPTEDWGHIGDSWHRGSADALRLRQRTCRWVAGGLRRPVLRGLAGATLSVFPGFARPVLRRLGG